MKDLTIVIPTYNRCQFVEENVRNILPQVREFKERVSVLVCDNNSTDDTENVLMPLVEKNKDIVKYHKHSENIGAHANFYYGVKHSDSEYVFLLGDDDLIAPNFLYTIFKIIEDTNRPHLIFTNYVLGDASLRKVSLLRTDFRGDFVITYNDGADFIKKYLMGPSFMSSVVFKKEAMIYGLENNYHQDVYGYDWLLCLLTGCMGHKCVFNKTPILVQRSGDIYPSFALNTIVGPIKLFGYLEYYAPNVTDIWEKHFYSTTEYYRALYSIVKFDSFYKERLPEILPFLHTGTERFLLRLSMWHPKINKSYIFLYAYTMFRRLMIKIEKFRKKKQ